MVAFHFVSYNLFSQNISPTNSIVNCAICVPIDWEIISGTPDVSDRFIAAASGSYQSGIPWDNAPLPLPFNNHLNWLSLRDVSSSYPEEIVGTSMSNLISGLSYEVFVYTMTTRSTASPGYSPQYNDYYRYKIGNNAIVDVFDISHDEWQINRFPFTANSDNINIEFYPGNNAINLSNLESVQISVSEDAINAIPIADDNSETTDINTPITFIITDTDYDPDGNIDVSTVDLDPITPGFQNLIVTTEGVWSVDNFGYLTFTPSDGFIGIATLNYTVNDDFTLDGINLSATSNIAFLSVTVLDPCLNFENGEGLKIYQAFSPNGDSFNEYFIIEGIDCYPENEIKVFNRWGKLVFETTNYSNDWNGIANNNEKLPVGVYFYYLRLDNSLRQKTGWVYILKK